MTMRNPLIKMMFRRHFWFALTCAFILNGCLLLDESGLIEDYKASEKYKETLYFSNSYSLDGVQTYRFDLSCENTKFVRIDAGLKEDYCSRLVVEYKKLMEKEFPGWRIDEDNPDIWI